MSQNINSSMSPATQSEVERGTAVFWIPGKRSKVYDLGAPLPVAGLIITDIEVGENEPIRAGTAITIIQAEIVDGEDILIGFTYSGGAAVCTLDQVRLAPESSK